MRLPIPYTLFALVLAAVSLGGCGSPGLTKARTPAAVPAAMSSGAVGDTATFALRLLRIGYAPDRVSYELTKPAYLTLIAVTDSTIEPLMPLVSEDPRIEMAGEHTTGLNRGRESMPGYTADAEANADPRVAELQAYNRCMDRAIQLDKRRREASRPIIGRDSAGRPIYGPPNPSVELDRTYESMCRMPTASSNVSRVEPARPARRNRYLIVYVSDTPVRHDAIVALRISEHDPRLFTAAIGARLFTGREARWAGYFRPW